MIWFVSRTSREKLLIGPTRRRTVVLLSREKNEKLLEKFELSSSVQYAIRSDTKYGIKIEFEVSYSSSWRHNGRNNQTNSDVYDTILL